jgi:hypothetical protein
MTDEGKEEKVLESRVVKEEIVRKEGVSLKRKLGVALLAVAFGASGYGIKTLETGSDHYAGHLKKASKQYMLEVCRKAVTSGYSSEVWGCVPEEQQHEIVRGYLTEMQLAKSWDIVLPVVQKKARKRWKEFKAEMMSMERAVEKGYLKGKGRRPKEKPLTAYKILKDFLGDGNGDH